MMNRTVTPGRPATEERNPLSHRLGEMSTIQILELLNDEDAHAVSVVRSTLPTLTSLVDAAVERVREGGRVHYFGAGTSGRLGVLDAAELVPTFGLTPDRVQAHIAGGEAAIVHAVEDAEDSESDGMADARAVAAGDVVIGITVSGTTAYVRGALIAARRKGALTALITSNPGSPLTAHADYFLAPETGPEVVTGSTRLKAGTATKILLNGFSTALMIRLGRTHSNLMVAVKATNRKLRERVLRILAEVTGEDPARTAERLDGAGGDLRVAVVAAVAEVDPKAAVSALADTGESVPEAIRRLAPPERR